MRLIRVVAWMFVAAFLFSIWAYCISAFAIVTVRTS